MKRLWVAFLGAALLVSSWGGASWAKSLSSAAGAHGSKISGCNAKGTVSYMFWGDKGDAAVQNAVVALAEKFCPGLHVNKIWDQGNYDTDLATKIGSGNAPDLFQLDAAKRLPEFVTEGALTNLDPYIKKVNLNMKGTYWSTCLKETQYNGHYYGLMRDCGNQSILFYNKDMFQAKHVALPTNNWTYKDFRSAAIKLTGDYSLPTDTSSKLRFGYAFNNDDYRLEQYLWEWGSDWLSSNRKTCTLNSAKSQAAITWWHDLMYKDHGAPTATQQTAAGNYFDGFRNQRYAMTFAGAWALDYMFGKGLYSTTTPPTFKWGAALTPSGPVNRQALVDAAIEGVYSKSKNKNAAFWLARFVTTGKGAALEGEYGIGIPGDKSLARDTRVKKEYGSLLSVMLQANKYGRALTNVPQYDNFWNTVSKDLDPMWKNETSVSAATNKACADAKQYLP